MHGNTMQPYWEKKTLNQIWKLFIKMRISGGG